MVLNVLLLHQPSKDAQDGYEALLRTTGHCPFSLAASETEYVNLPALRDLLLRGGGLHARGFGGVIVTSQRSCEAVARAFALERDGEDDGDDARADLRSR